MSDKINLLQRASEIEISPQFEGVTKLVCQISDDSEMVAGTDTGYTLEFSDPMMTRETLNAMLEKIRGHQYQPYRVDGAILDPAAEMGDAVSTQKLSAGIFSRSRTFGTLMKADISAPTDQEIEHEYKFETREERNVRRQLGDMSARLQVLSEGISAEAEARTEMGDEFRGQLEIQATEIGAKVSADTSSSMDTFGWKLNATSWEVYAGGKTVLKASEDGLEIAGTASAINGKIGGFTIGANAIYKTIAKFNGTAKSGVYLGTDGIQVGQGFRVSAAGELKLKGTITFVATDGTETTLTAARLREGAYQSYKNHEGWTSGASAGTSAKKIWDAAQNDHVGTDIVASYLNVRSNYFIMNGTTVEFIAAPSLGGYVLGTRGEG